jgi:hypothetical protein
MESDKKVPGGGGACSTAVCHFLDAHDLDVAVLTEWRFRV